MKTYSWSSPGVAAPAGEGSAPSSTSLSWDSGGGTSAVSRATHPSPGGKSFSSHFAAGAKATGALALAASSAWATFFWKFTKDWGSSWARRPRTSFWKAGAFQVWGR